MSWTLFWQLVLLTAWVPIMVSIAVIEVKKVKAG